MTVVGVLILTVGAAVAVKDQPAKGLAHCGVPQRGALSPGRTGCTGVCASNHHAEIVRERIRNVGC